MRQSSESPSRSNVAVFAARPQDVHFGLSQTRSRIRTTIFAGSSRATVLSFQTDASITTAAIAGAAQCVSNTSRVSILGKFLRKSWIFCGEVSVLPPDLCLECMRRLVPWTLERRLT